MNWNFNINWTHVSEVIISCLVIIAITYIAFLIIKGIIYRFIVGRKKEIPRLQTLASLASNFIGYVLFFVAVVALLDQFGINATGLIASAGIIGLAIGFGAQGLVSDIVTGFFILMEDQVNVNDHITVNGFSGVVEQTGLRVLKIRDLNGDLHFIPNRELKSLTNHSKGTSNTIVNVKIPYSNGQDMLPYISEIQAKLNQLKTDMPQIVEGPAVLDVHTPNKAENYIRIIAKTEPNQGIAVANVLEQHAKEIVEVEKTVTV
ncbi:mechanosensitive ion channel family protein [Shimazuella sp. AN120528]|uniref:mechanosensitive ion channel family protein n=1 Tax=Shimazuella soli TaxID=1892854 RepID=UPI001F10965D|nr:mechanosensitive ion channel domain-containing protein [Shimazuella soli]MCH5585735.1 mechanosensitive ion channel family protein [Shimazuella soli]